MRITLAIVVAVALTCSAAAQEKKDPSNSSIVTKMMAFNKKHDGKLTKDEVTDERLHRLFDMADTNKDGIVTKEELMALAAKLEAEQPQGGRGGPGGGGAGGPGGPGGGPGGPGGPGGRGPGGFGPPQPGTILPPFLQDELKLSPDQKKQLEQLQKDVDAKLAKILTDEQKKQMKDMADRGGPGGRGGPGRGPGGEGGRPGGPGGRGPGGDRPPE